MGGMRYTPNIRLTGPAWALGRDGVFLERSDNTGPTTRFGWCGWWIAAERVNNSIGSGTASRREIVPGVSLYSLNKRFVLAAACPVRVGWSPLFSSVKSQLSEVSESLGVERGESVSVLVAAARGLGDVRLCMGVVLAVITVRSPSTLPGGAGASISAVTLSSTCSVLDDDAGASEVVNEFSEHRFSSIEFVADAGGSEATGEVSDGAVGGSRRLLRFRSSSSCQSMMICQEKISVSIAANADEMKRSKALSSPGIFSEKQKNHRDQKYNYNSMKRITSISKSEQQLGLKC